MPGSTAIVMGAALWVLGTGGPMGQSADVGWLHALGWDWIGGGDGGHESVHVRLDTAIGPWQTEHGDPECEFWNGTFQWKLGLCSHFSLSRLGAGTMALAVERAVQCAARHATDCVLAPEVGVGFPALFLYDANQGMRLLLAPRILDNTDKDAVDVDGSEKTVRVRVHDVIDKTDAATLAMQPTVRVEYLTTGSKKLQVEALYGNEAFCVQLARHAIAAECWEALD